jgi:hypothetical protein
VKTIVVDAEYGHLGGVQRPSAFAPIVFCALDPDSGRRWSFWGRDPRLAQFIGDHAGDLFVSHNLVAEAQYMLRLGVRPPARWFDTMLAWRWSSNAEAGVPYGLEAVLAAVGIPHAFAGEKGDLQKWIGELRFDPHSPDDQRRIEAYCRADVTATGQLYQRLVGRVPDTWMNFVTEYSLAVAKMGLRGLPLDVGDYTRLMGQKDRVVGRVTAQVNAAYPVFIDNQLSRERFFRWCLLNGVAWPKTYDRRDGSRKLRLDKRSFEMMKGRDPFIQAVHEARKTVTQLNDRTLAVDLAAGRHYPDAIVCAQTTGRTSPVGSILGGPKWLRYLLAPRPGHVLVVVDFVAEEFAVAAHLAGDGAMTKAYLAGDPHLAFAAQAGAAPPGATKKTHKAVRAKYKTVNLGVLYGQTPHGMAAQTGMHHAEAQLILAQHRRMFPKFWAWADAYTTRAFTRGTCRTVAGWPRRVTPTDNPRSVVNLPVQGGGADLLRLAVIYLTRLGAPLLTTVHDSFIFECAVEYLPRLHEVLDFALGRAVGELFPGSPLRWEVSEYHDRYRDEDGRDTWKGVNQILAREGEGGGEGELKEREGGSSAYPSSSSYMDSTPIPPATHPPTHLPTKREGRGFMPVVQGHGAPVPAAPAVPPPAVVPALAPAVAGPDGQGRDIEAVKRLPPFERLLWWIVEREAIRQRRLAGQGWPWTEYAILRDYSFCCPRRMDDRTSRWLLEHWYDPHRDHPNLLLACVLARRLFNSVEILAEIGFPDRWDPARVKAILRERAAAGKRLEHTAYVIPPARGVAPGTPKCEGLIDWIVQPLVNYPPRLDTSSMRASVEARTARDGFGTFTAGQVVADLRWAVSGAWADKGTWAPQGPGSTEGLRRLAGQTGKAAGVGMSQNEFERRFARVLAEIRGRLPADLAGQLEAMDIQNCLCEMAKAEKLLWGEPGRRRKYVWRGRPAAAAPGGGRTPGPAFSRPE